jgi:cytidylate kinase
MKKLVIVINGAGGVGKDTLCAFAAGSYRVRNVSSVDPIKAMARMGGWDGDKSDKSRKMLSDLKMLFTQYNDLCLRYITEQYQQFLDSEEQVMFVHIREPEEIARFVAVAPERIKTLLITNSAKERHVYQNASDDNVAQYSYDAVYDNILPLEETEKAFLDFFCRWFEENSFEI